MTRRSAIAICSCSDQRCLSATCELRPSFICRQEKPAAVYTLQRLAHPGALRSEKSLPMAAFQTAKKPYRVLLVAAAMTEICESQDNSHFAKVRAPRRFVMNSPHR